jgi:hypothetical protein
MLVFCLKKNSGFFSEIFFMLNYYLICNKNNIPFSINSVEWLFKYEKGWHDYFDSLDELSYNRDFYYISNSFPEETNYYGDIDFTLLDYKNIMIDIFKFNNKLQNIYNDTIKNLGLINYHAIFIRRGDKLIRESIYIPTARYIDILLKNDNVDILFIQTDDYNVSKLAKNIIQKQEDEIRDMKGILIN